MSNYSGPLVGFTNSTDMYSTETADQLDISSKAAQKAELLAQKKARLGPTKEEVEQAKSEERNRVQNEISRLEGFVPTDTKDISKIASGIGYAAVESHGLSRLSSDSRTSDYNRYQYADGTEYKGDVGEIRLQGRTGELSAYLVPSLVADTVQSLARPGAIHQNGDLQMLEDNKEADVYKFQASTTTLLQT
jgi:hypothetical protein